MTLDYFALDAAQSLDIVPVGTDNGGDESTIAHLAEQLDGVERVTTESGELDVEAIAALEPDMLLGSGGQLADEQYDVLSEIAPTVLVPETFENSGAWKDIFDELGTALAGPERAGEVVDGYDERVAEVAESLVDSGTVQLLNVTTTELYVDLRDSFPGIVLDDLGLAAPAEEPADGFVQTLSLEQVTEANGEALFVLPSGSGDPDAAYADLQAGPLWARLPAVQAGQVFPASDYWIRAGYASAELMLDDIEQALAG